MHGGYSAEQSILDENEESNHDGERGQFYGVERYMTVEETLLQKNMVFKNMTYDTFIFKLAMTLSSTGAGFSSSCIGSRLLTSLTTGQGKNYFGGLVGVSTENS